MRHARLLVHQLHVDGSEVTVSLATLVVVKRNGTSALDWELVADTVNDPATELGSCELDLVVVSGGDEEGVPELSDLHGPAVVVRYVDSTIVWRGNGPLQGFDEAWLT